MKIYKTMRKRGLALFLALTMCLSLIQTTAFANEEAEHAHNEGGWTCAYTDPVTEPACVHEHDAACGYVEAVEEIPCVCTGTDGEGSVVHEDGCAYAPAVEGAPCGHVCGGECAAVVTEGYWECTPPAGEPEDTEPTEDAEAPAGDAEVPEEDAEAPAGDTEVPAEVQAFLDAVAAIPEITAENAAEVAENVYGPVSEAYDALLGTEYEERDDVQEVVAVYAAALVELETYLEESTTLAVARAIPGKVIDAGSITKEVGQSGFYQRLPRSTNVCPTYGYVLSEYIPDSYNNFEVTFSDQSILKDYNEVLGKFKEYGSYQGYPCFQFNYTGAKPGVTSVGLYFEYGYYYRSESGRGRCGHYHTIPGNYNTYYDQVTFDVIVKADYELIYDANGGEVDPASEKKTQASTSCSFTLPTPTRDGYIFKGWAESKDAATGVIGTYILDWSEGFGSVTNPVTKTLYALWSPDNTQTYTVVYKDGAEEAVFGDETHGNLSAGDNTPSFTGKTERTGYTFEGWAPAWKNTVDPEMAEDGVITYTATWQKNASPTTSYTVVHEYYTNDIKDGEFRQNGGEGEVGTTISADDIEKILQYEENTYVYTSANPDSITLEESGNTITLRYDRTVPLTDNKPTAPTEQQVNKLVKGSARAAVEIYCQPERHQVGYFDCYNESEKNPGVNTHPGRVEIGQVEGNDTDGYTCEVTFLSEVYLKAYNELKKTTDVGKAHVLCDINGNDLTADKANQTVKFAWDMDAKEWKLADGKVGPVKFWTKCPDSTPAETITYKVHWIDESSNKVLNAEERTAPMGTEVTVTDSDKTYTGYQFNEGNKDNVLSATLGVEPVILKLYFTKLPSPSASLKVEKSNDGFKVNEQTGNASVDYTVNITNNGDVAIYGLRLTDTLTANLTPDNGSVTFTFKDWKVGDQAIDPTSGGENDKVHVLQLLPRNVEFKTDQTVTLTYTVEIENNSDGEVEVELKNEATGASWSKAPANPAARTLSLRAANEDDEPDVTDSDSSSASTDNDAPDVTDSDTSTAGGPTGDSGTEGTLPKKYTVTYAWDLPKGADEELPASEKRPAGATITVDTTYSKDYEITVDGKTYVFSGWSVAGVTIADGKFTMPAQNVIITGTWTEREEQPPATPLSVSAADVRVTYDGKGHPVIPTANKDGVQFSVVYKGANGVVGVPTDAGVYTAEITATLNGETASCTASVTITRRPLTVTTGSGSKYYDGTPLTNSTATVVVTGGEVPGEHITAVATGSRTVAGSSTNTYTMNWGSAKESNYTVTESLGTLTVLNRAPIIPPPPSGGGNTGGGTTIPDTQTPLDPGTTIADQDVPLAAPGLNNTDHFDYIKGYVIDGQSLVRPEANITRAEVATIFFRLMTKEFHEANWATENDFTDVKKGDWYNNAISTCTKAGILKGYEDGTFKPNQTISREEFAAIAARFASEEVPAGGVFKDIAGRWSEKDIERAAAMGWIKGSNGLFRPVDKITRAEVIVIVNRMLDRVPDADHMLPDMKTFVDNTPDMWWYADVQEAANSHEYDRAEDGVTGIWTSLLPEQDWAALEEEWATAADANVADVAPKPGTEEGAKEPETTGGNDGNSEE